MAEQKCYTLSDEVSVHWTGFQCLFPDFLLSSQAAHPINALWAHNVTVRLWLWVIVVSHVCRGQGKQLLISWL